MQFLIIAYDAKDDDAINRRLAVRKDHLENIMKVKERGSVISAGGILDDNGKMIGSMLAMKFDSRDLFDEYLASEPYIKNHVWEDIRIEHCNIVIQNDEIVGV